MRGDAKNFKLKIFIKQCSSLIACSFEIPHSAYSSRYTQCALFRNGKLLSIFLVRKSN